MLQDRKNVVRLILFLLALGIAVTAFSMGVTQIGRRESGYYEVEPTAQANATVFDSGVRLTYYFEGKSSQIRLQQNELQKQFSDVLLRAYQLLDARHTYEGMNNLASLNRRPGEEMPIDPALWAVLSDALDRQALGEGYSPFAGAVEAEWDALLYLEEPEGFDPLVDEYQAERIQALSGAEAHCALALREGTAAFTVDGEYLSLLEEYEVSAPVLTLGRLRDAYLLDLVARELAALGYTRGYLHTDGGLTVMLEKGQCEYALYTLLDGKSVPACALLSEAPSACCLTHAFPAAGQQYGYYSVQAGGKTHLRYGNVDARTGQPGEALLSGALVGGGGDLVDLAYRAFVASLQVDGNAVLTYMRSLPEGYLAAWTLQGAGDRLSVWGDASRVTPAEGVALLTP